MVWHSMIHTIALPAIYCCGFAMPYLELMIFFYLNLRYLSSYNLKQPWTSKTFNLKEVV